MSDTATEEQLVLSAEGPPEKPAREWNRVEFNQGELKQAIKVNSYNKHITLTISRLLYSGSLKHPAAIEYFIPYLDPLQQKVADKAKKSYQRLHSLSRTGHDQLLAALRQVEFPEDFPQEKYQLAMVALDEAETLSKLMSDEAERIRLEFQQGNFRWVDKLS